MDTRVFEEWISEKRIKSPLLSGKEIVLFVNNASGHKKTGKAIEALKCSFKKLEFLPKNASELCQPVDSFIIQKTKNSWRRMCAEKKLEMIRKKEWVNWKSGSGKLSNRGKMFYLKRAASVICEVWNEKDKVDSTTFERL